MCRKPLLGILIVALVGVGVYAQGIVINEVAWAGAASNTRDEWIELYNPTDSAVDLSGWTLTFGDRVIDLGEAANTIVEPSGYFLLERTDDDTVSDVSADLIYTGGLTNQGMLLSLFDQAGAVVDTANDGQESWAAGTAKEGEIPYATMERIDPTSQDVATNWASNNGLITCGHDAAGETINGTPRAKNSATIVWETVPTVTITNPSEEGQTVSDDLVIAWQAQDPDGEDGLLQADIYVSDDGGNTFSTSVNGLVGHSYVWNTTGVENGDQYLLKVAVKDIDGNVGEATSPMFSIAN
ncbi:MAG: lamin tail domain-containing protein [Candidatus Bipolaricaulota bacterium]|nr:lamin tail domain-containing protein [Candidatus Bipolaricaulota bacterium]